MIKKLEITGLHVELDQKLKNYATKKIGNLDKYIPRNARASAHAVVVLKEVQTKTKNNKMCEVVMHLPHKAITIEEATVNMYAAIDIVEVKLKNQIRDYKNKHTPSKLHHRAAARLRAYRNR